MFITLQLFGSTRCYLDSEAVFLDTEAWGLTFYLEHSLATNWTSLLIANSYHSITDLSYLQKRSHLRYLRNWYIFDDPYPILSYPMTLIYLQPRRLGQTLKSRFSYFGLWRAVTSDQMSANTTCSSVIAVWWCPLHLLRVVGDWMLFKRRTLLFFWYTSTPYLPAQNTE